MRSAVSKGMTILVGPTEIAGYYSSLVHGLRACGCEAIYGVIHSNHFAYGQEHPCGHLRRLCLFLWVWGANRRTNLLIWLFARLMHQLLGALYFLFLLPWLDAAIFGFGHSYLPFNLDLPLLRLCGKVVIVNLGHGSDMRPAYVDGSYLQDDGSGFIAVERLVAIAKRSRSRVRWIERWATYFIGAPLSSSVFASRSYVNWFAIGIPFSGSSDLAAPLPSSAETEARCSSFNLLKIIHAPSKPLVKGSSLIRQAIHNLQQIGFRIDYQELHGLPNHEVLDALSRCDLVVDQLFSDTPMAGLAVEAAFYGKPSLVAGYGLRQLNLLLPETYRPPTFTCHPDDFEFTLHRLLTQPELLRHVGDQAREFVTNAWGPTVVAERYLRLIRRDVPSDWWFDPRQLNYLHGCGMPESQLMQSVARVVQAFGLKGLQLSHRPDLEQSYLDFAHSGLSSSLD